LPKSLVCKAVTGGVGREAVGLDEDEEDEARCCCCCVLGELDLGIVDDVEDCGCCRTLFTIVWLMSSRPPLRGSDGVLLNLEFIGDSGRLDATLSCLVRRADDLERDRE